MTRDLEGIPVPREGTEPRFHDLRGVSGEAPPLAARAALWWSPKALSILFDVAAEPPLVLDRSPAWANDCVEAFLAPEATPWSYLELVVDASGAIYAARVENPNDSRATWRVDPQEPPPGTVLAVDGEGQPRERTLWRARLSIPWETLGFAPGSGARFRGNLFRIARGRAVRHLALAPPHRTAPPDFHVPSRFAAFVLL